MKSTLRSLALFSLVASPALAPAQTQRPNILFILADDLTYETLGSLNLTDIDTPNLNRLAQRGTTFTRAYNMGSWMDAVCVASRTMLVTGFNMWDAKSIYPTANSYSSQFWPKLLSRGGYRTYMAGKWHVGPSDSYNSVAQCFDVMGIWRPGMPADGNSPYNRPRDGVINAWSPYKPDNTNGYFAGGTHWSVVTADNAISYLTQPPAGTDTSKPFFMYVAFNAAHDQRQSPKEYVDRYPLARISLPPNYLPEYPYKNDIGAVSIGSGALRDETLAPTPRTEYAIRVHRREYYALITHLDAQVGRILDALEATGQADNTWIFFTADQGLSVGHHGLMGKQNLYEDSTRVPFIVAGPGVPQNVRKDVPIYLQDVMPTSLEIAGVAKPSRVFFNSLLPFLNGTRQNSYYDSIYGCYNDGPNGSINEQRSITKNNWKLIVYPRAANGAGVIRLFNLVDDPLEMNDLASDPQQAHRKRYLLDELIKLQAQMQDPLDLSAQFPKTGFVDWGAAHGLAGADAAPDADPNHDAIPNLIAYAFDINPVGPATEANHAKLPQMGKRADGNAAFFFNRDTVLPDIVYEVETSTDLQHWDGEPSVAVENSTDGFELCSVPVADEPRRFFRVRVTQK